MEDRRAVLKEAMAGMANGDRGSLDTVFEMTSAKLFATIIRIVRSREVAEDVLQEVYVRTWQRASRFDPAKGSAITWLCTIARNAALNEIRSSKRRAEIADDVLPEVADATIAADDWLCNVEDSAAIHRCLEDLQSDQRRTIRLAFFDGYTHSELAELIDTPLGTVKSWIRRGLAGLKGCLDA